LIFLTNLKKENIMPEQEKKIGNSIFYFEQQAGIDSPFGNWRRKKDTAKEAEKVQNNTDTQEISFSCQWYSDKERKNRTTEAVIGDTIYYKIICRGILDNTKLRFEMYDKNLFGKTYLCKYQDAIIKNGIVESSVFFGTEYFEYIDKDSGNEIEIYWVVKYKGKEYNIYNTILNLEDDEYVRAILGEPNSKDANKRKPRYVYTCNCGWVDKTHAWADSERGNEIYNIGAYNLWKQIKEEKGERSLWEDGFKVSYRQDATRFRIGVTNEYFVRYGLPVKIKERIAMAIFQEVSLEFEKLQRLYLFSGSSFEPSDLVSNILGFYTVLRPKLTKEYILTNLSKALTAMQSLSVYKKYPGTFTLKQYKNRKFTPLFFENEFCKNPVFPKEFQEIKPYSKDEINFSDWVDLFDVHKGVPPITDFK
jgi:hypothetical protein